MGVAAGMLLVILVSGSRETLSKKAASISREAIELLRVKVRQLVVG